MPYAFVSLHSMMEYLMYPTSETPPPAHFNIFRRSWPCIQNNLLGTLFSVTVPCGGVAWVGMTEKRIKASDKIFDDNWRLPSAGCLKRKRPRSQERCQICQLIRKEVITLFFRRKAPLFFLSCGEMNVLSTMSVDYKSRKTYSRNSIFYILSTVARNVVIVITIGQMFAYSFSDIGKYIKL